jgi:hypothetical protein
VGIGTLGTAPVGTGTAPGFYTGNTKLRVAFKGTGANQVTYYACKERFNNGSNRNCTPIGTGSYTITTLGDARVMTLNNLPAQASPLTFTRVFVERGGRIYLGYQNKPNQSNSARLNLTGTNALFSQLGLPAVDPNTPLALTAASYQGSWELFIPGLTVGPIFTINPNGSSSCVSGGNSPTPYLCTITITDPATGAFTQSSATGGGQGNFNFLAGTASGTYNDSTLTPTTGTATGQRR